MNAADLFDVEPYRATRTRRAVVRLCPRPTLVLGSTQPESVVDHRALARAGVAMARRRTGGGAVLLEPDDPVWVDVWVPRRDPLWDDDAARAVHWVGEWWSETLAKTGFGPTEVQQRGGGAFNPLAATVCFAGLGAGEVHRGGRKVVGIAQWRSKEGALIHCATYRRWAPEPLLDLLVWRDEVRTVTREELAIAALGFGEPDGTSRGTLILALLDTLPDGEWDVSVEGTA